MSTDPASTNPRIQMIPSVDPYKHLDITLNSDGSLKRHSKWFADTPAMPDPNPTNLILSKDIPINLSHETSLRLFLPLNVLNYTSATNKKLPLIVYFHGSGFIVGSARNSLFHDYCSEVASDLHAIVASVEYRLAPEHRLPAAYDDAMDALHCLKTSRDDWLTQHADLTSCFLMGSSAGGTIAYHVGLRLVDPSSNDDLMPLQIKGFVLVQPFFGGVHMTESEKRAVNDPILPYGVCDMLWELALPSGVGRDHEYCNPIMRSDLEVVLHKIRETGWKYLVIGFGGDPLVDRQIALANLFEENRIFVVRHFTEGGLHGADIHDPTTKRDVLDTIKKFMASISEL